MEDSEKESLIAKERIEGKSIRAGWFWSLFDCISHLEEGLFYNHIKKCSNLKANSQNQIPYPKNWRSI